MNPKFLEKTALCISGATALVIGASILISPQAFYSSYGITLGEDASLLSELRAPGAALAVLGVLMLLGIWIRTFLPISIAAALTVFIAFPAGRVVGMAMDGMPSGGIVAALFIELAIAGLCLVAFRQRLGRPAPTHRNPQPAR